MTDRVDLVLKELQTIKNDITELKSEIINVKQVINEIKTGQTNVLNNTHHIEKQLEKAEEKVEEIAAGQTILNEQWLQNTIDLRIIKENLPIKGPDKAKTEA